MQLCECLLILQVTLLYGESSPRAHKRIGKGERGKRKMSMFVVDRNLQVIMTLHNVLGAGSGGNKRVLQ